jgi:hypothetical protein
MSSAINLRNEGEESNSYSMLSRHKSHDSQNSSSSSSRLKKIINVFNPWSSQSPSSTPPSTAGGSRRVRKIGLKPRAKVARDAVQKTRQTYFLTEMGRRRLPRRSTQLRPTAKMIQDARRGHLTKFLREGEITRADNFGEDMVNPQTADIYLDYDHDFVTDHLSDESEDMDDEVKDKTNLYYISVHRDELPTYHFWQRGTDPDPLQARRPIDWEAVFNERLPAVLAEEEQEGQLNGVTSRVVKSNSADQKVENAWMPGGKHHRELNPKRSVRPALSTRTANNVSSESGWATQGSIAGLVWNSSNNGISEGSRQCGPQPGDPEWEAAEAEWETRLRDANSLKTFLAQYRRDEGAKHAELTAPRTSPVLRPIHGDDAGSQSYNAILKTAVPTVSFKLTQQQFGRPVSPLKGNEPLCRGEDPSNWDPGHNADENSGLAGGQLVYHKEEPLEFLDFYDQRSYGQPMIRRMFLLIPIRLTTTFAYSDIVRKPIPEEYIQREPPHRSGIADPFDIVGSALDEPAPESEPDVGLKNAFAPSKNSKASASRVLLQGDDGGLYLYEMTYESFLATAKRLLPNSIDKGAGLNFWADIKKADAANIQAVNIDMEGGQRTFEATIKPLLATHTCGFRIRHSGDLTQSFKRSQYTGSSIKLNHKSIGYGYLAVRWVDAPAGHSQLGYPSEVMVKAISFLFPETSRKGIRFTLVIQGEGSHDVDLRNGDDAAVKARVQAILRRLTEENKGRADPIEVQIYEAAHPPFHVSNQVPSRDVVTDQKKDPIPKDPSRGPVVKPGPGVPPTTTGQGQPPRGPPVPAVPPTQPLPKPTEPLVPATQPLSKPTGPTRPTTQDPAPENTRTPFSIPQPPRHGVSVDKVTLIRPARSDALELTAPFTAQRILKQVHELYRPLDHDWTIRVFPTEAAWRHNQYFTVSADVMSDTETAQDFVAEFREKIEQNGSVYIYKELVSYHFVKSLESSLSNARIAGFDPRQRRHRFKSNIRTLGPQNQSDWCEFCQSCIDINTR